MSEIETAEKLEQMVTSRASDPQLQGNRNTNVYTRVCVNIILPTSLGGASYLIIYKI